MQSCALNKTRMVEVCVFWRPSYTFMSPLGVRTVIAWKINLFAKPKWGDEKHANIFTVRRVCSSDTATFRQSGADCPQLWASTRFYIVKEQTFLFFFFLQDGQHLLIVSSLSAQARLCGPTFFSGFVTSCSEFYHPHKRKGEVHQHEIKMQPQHCVQVHNWLSSLDS